MRERPSSSSKPARDGSSSRCRYSSARRSRSRAISSSGRSTSSPARRARDVPDERRVRDARVVVPAPVEVVEAVAGGHVEPRVLDLLERLEPAPARPRSPRARPRSRHAGAPRRTRRRRRCRWRASPACGAPRSGLKRRTSIPATICATCWSGMSGSCALAQLREGHVRAVAEQQELEVVLPHEVAAAERPLVRVEHLVERRVAVVLERHLVRLVLGEVGDAEVRDLRDQRPHLVLELGVQLVPVRVVVAGTLLEELGPLGDLRGVRDGVARDVDVAVHDPVVDAHRGRYREDAVLPDAERLVGAVDAGHIEGRHRHREVHRVPEPEPALVRLPPRLVEHGVVRVHLLPALAPGGRLDLVRARER